MLWRSDSCISLTLVTLDSCFIYSNVHHLHALNCMIIMNSFHIAIAKTLSIITESDKEIDEVGKLHCFHVC